MSDSTAANTSAVQQWASTFNTDVEALAALYAPEFVANGAPMTRDKLVRFERRVLAAAPKRSIRVERTHAVGEVTAVEGVLLDPDQGAEWKLPFCAVLTWQDGSVINDFTYTDFSRWPGMS